MLNLIEGRPSGLLKVLDDEAFVGPQGSEEQFMRNVDRAHKTNDLLHICTLQDKLHHKWPNPGFVITHYAGKVVYDVHGFLEKNKDPVSPDLTDMLIGSKGSLSKALFADKCEPIHWPGGNTGYGMNVRKPTHRTSLGGQFRSQLVHLWTHRRPILTLSAHQAQHREETTAVRRDVPLTAALCRHLERLRSADRASPSGRVSRPALVPSAAAGNEGYTNELHFNPRRSLDKTSASARSYATHGNTRSSRRCGWARRSCCIAPTRCDC